jgi:hypothetical protein
LGLPIVLASLFSMGEILERLSSQTPNRAVNIQTLVGHELFEDDVSEFSVIENF